jgi:NADH-quinone oxidoreductase subunit H
MLFWISTTLKVLVAIGFLAQVAAILLWVERKQSAMMQNRIGPNRATIKIGRFEIRAAGLVHSIADGIKMVWKADWEPTGGDHLLYRLAPIIAIVPALCLCAVIPFGPTVFIDHARDLYDPAWATDAAVVARSVPLQIANLDVGVLFVFAVAGAGVIGAALAGWSSDNKFSLMGGLRAASQMVSYEVAMGISLVGAMMIYQTVRLDEMVTWQTQHCWGIFVQPVAFVLFCTAAIAETKRVPFDTPEGESELVAGYFTEYAGLKMAMFASGEFVEVCVSSALITTIFLGGWQFPFVQLTGLEFHYFGINISWHWAHFIVVAVSFLSFCLKCVFLIFMQLQVRWTLPRFRYDQIMKLGWRMLLPAALLNVLVTGTVLLFLNSPSAH